VKKREVGIVFRFDSEDDDHAIDQFMSFLYPGWPNIESMDYETGIEVQFIRDSINHVEEIDDE